MKPDRLHVRPGIADRLQLRAVDSSANLLGEAPEAFEKATHLLEAAERLIGRVEALEFLYASGRVRMSLVQIQIPDR